MSGRGRGHGRGKDKPKEDDKAVGGIASAMTELASAVTELSVAGGGPNWEEAANALKLFDRENRSPLDLKRAVEYAKRPDGPQFAIDGLKRQIRVNYLPIALNDDAARRSVAVYVVRIEFGEQITNRTIRNDERFEVFWHLVLHGAPLDLAKDDAAALKVLRNNIAYDSDTVLYVSKELHFGSGKLEIKGYRVALFGDQDRLPFNIEIRPAGSITPDLTDPTRVLLQHVDFRAEVTTVHLMNTVVGQCAGNLAFQEPTDVQVLKRGQNAYFRPTMPTQQIDLKAGVSVWFGVFHNVVAGTLSTTMNTNTTAPPQLYINIDATNAIFYKDQSMLEYICEALNDMGHVQAYFVNGITNATFLPLPLIHRLYERLKGLRVYTTHTGGYRVHTCNGISAHGADAKEFDMVDGQRVSVSHYMKNRYGIELRYPRMPLIMCGRRIPAQVGNAGDNAYDTIPSDERQRRPNICYLPMELLSVNVPQKAPKKAIPEDATSTMIRSLSRPPIGKNGRMAEIERVYEKSHLCRDAIAGEFGVTTGNELLEIESVILQPPTILHARGQTLVPSDGVWDPMKRRVQFIEPTDVRFEKYFVLSFKSNMTLPDELAQPLRTLHQMASTLGMSVGGLVEPACHVFNQVSELRDLPDILKEMTVKKGKPNFVLCVTNRRDREFYASVKQHCDVRLGLPSQFVLTKNLRPLLKPMTAFNILLKMHAKMGGANWMIQSDPMLNGGKDQKRYMFIGLDVSHPSNFFTRASDVTREPAICAAVGSLGDVGSFRYHASVKIQKPNAVSTLHIYDALVDLLKAYTNASSGGDKLPDRLIIYRDGVAESMFVNVVNEELQGIESALGHESVRKHNIQVTYIVCQRNHHVRLFPMSKEEGVGPALNVAPGTVADRCLVSPHHYDFYLCSHFGLKGTSRPARYTVIRDDAQLPIDTLEKLTYALCHLYCRCPRSVSIPAPAYYAHKVAERAKDHYYDNRSGSSQVRFDNKMAEARTEALAGGNLPRIANPQTVRLDSFVEEVFTPHPDSKMYFV